MRTESGSTRHKTIAYPLRPGSIHIDCRSSRRGVGESSGKKGIHHCWLWSDRRGRAARSLGRTQQNEQRVCHSKRNSNQLILRSSNNKQNNLVLKRVKTEQRAHKACQGNKFEQHANAIRNSSVHMRIYSYSYIGQVHTGLAEEEDVDMAAIGPLFGA